MGVDGRVRFGFGENVATVGGETEARKSGLDQDRDGGSRRVAISRVEVVTISLFFSVW